MADRRDDARGKKIVFVSSCLLNTNNKVKGLARYSGMCREVFDTLCDNGLGIQQMDCPETLYLGIQRWWYTKNLYDCRGFRDHCRELAERAVTYMEVRPGGLQGGGCSQLRRLPNLRRDHHQLR